MTKIATPIWVLALLGLIIVLLTVILWSVKRRRNPRFALEPHDNENMIPSIAGVTGGTCTKGNRVELVQNGEFYEWLYRDLETAQKTICFETFLSKEGEITRRIAGILANKARQDVQVRVMLDGSGGKKFGKAELKQMKEAGVKVGKYHPIRFSNLGILNNRDHRKLVIIDGRIGYIGGHCLVDTWLGNAEDKEHFRDISARVEGPVVTQFQSAFAENWIEETGEVIGGTNFFPEIDPAGEIDAHAVWISPSGAPSSVKLLHYLFIHTAKERITIQNPYFLPDPDGRDALIEAAKRGVEVRVMLPSADASDSPVVQHASHHHFGTLLKHGIKIYEYGRTLLHQKVMAVDGKYAAIGSTNFDDRSFEVNDEISLVVYDEKIAQELEKTFEEDLKHSTQAELEKWKKRPVLHKLKDFTLFLFNEQL
jgi:cardiolipin synthase A/B